MLSRFHLPCQCEETQLPQPSDGVPIECEHVYEHIDTSGQACRMFNQSNHWFDDRRHFDLFDDLQYSIHLLVVVPSKTLVLGIIQSFSRWSSHRCRWFSLLPRRFFFNVFSCDRWCFIVVLSNRRFHQLFPRLFAHVYANDDLCDPLQHCRSVVHSSAIVSISIRIWLCCFCWLCSLIFALPPLFSWNEYIPEGIGFHCGLNWFDRSFRSRLYFFFTFLFVYFHSLGGLVCREHPCLHFNSTFTPRNWHGRQLQHCSSTSQSTVSIHVVHQLVVEHRRENDVADGQVRLHSLVELCLRRLALRYSSHGGCDQAEQSHSIETGWMPIDDFALATIFLVSEYLLSWTPYAIVAILYLFDVRYFSEQPILMTICAFIAKISMILNPFIYVATVNTNQLGSILYCRKCSCSYCRSKRNDQSH